MKVNFILSSNYARMSNCKSVMQNTENPIEQSQKDTNTVKNFAYPKNYYLTSKKINFGAKESNYLVQDYEKGGLVPLLVYPGVDIKHFADGSGNYPEFKIDYGDFSGGKLSRCYMKNSVITNSNLSDTGIHKTHLHNSNLTGSNLTRAYAPDSVFKYTNFTNANLTDIRAVRSNFQNANFKNADLTRADFEEANLMGADLSQARNIYSASFNMAVYNDKTKFPIGFNPDDECMVKFEKGADVRGIYLKEGVIKSKDPFSPDDYSNIDFGSYNGYPSDLRRTRLSDVVLDYAKFKDIKGEGMSLANSSLYGAVFENANLESADLHGISTGFGTKFIGNNTNLQKANLINAELSDVGLENLPEGTLYGAFYSNTTTFPENFDPQKAGMVKMAPGSDFTDYNFSGMSFRDTSPHSNNIVSLADTTMKRVDFSDCDLKDMDMKNADCTQAYFRNANLQNADCSGVSFLGAKFPYTFAQGAKFKNTDLRWAKMQGLKIDEKTDFTGAKYNDDTVFPKDFPDSKKRTMTFIPRVMASEK